MVWVLLALAPGVEGDDGVDLEQSEEEDQPGSELDGIRLLLRRRRVVGRELLGRHFGEEAEGQWQEAVLVSESV